MTMTYASIKTEEGALAYIGKHMKSRSQWGSTEIGVGYGLAFMEGEEHDQKMFYYPLQRLLVYGSEAKGWKEIHGVSIADLNRVVANGDGLEELEKQKTVPQP